MLGSYGSLVLFLLSSKPRIATLFDQGNVQRSRVEDPAVQLDDGSLGVWERRIKDNFPVTGSTPTVRLEKIKVVALESLKKFLKFIFIKVGVEVLKVQLCCCFASVLPRPWLCRVFVQRSGFGQTGLGWNGLKWSSPSAWAAPWSRWPLRWRSLRWNGLGRISLLKWTEA